MRRRAISAALVAALMVLALLTSATSAAGEKYAEYGADLTPAERQELEQLFGAGVVKAETVTAQEMTAALQGTGLPVAATDKSISSSALTCLDKGAGLTVRTQNITRVPASTYADALVTAGVGDGEVLIAAPQANPVSGESALVGVLKAFPQCQAGAQPDPARVQLAYQQVARAVALAGPNGDLNKASALLLRAAQPVITGQARDDAAIGASLDAAAAEQGLPLDPAQRGATVSFLKELGGVDYGTYAKGYQVEQVSPTQVRVVPAGAGAPNPAPAGAPGAGAPAGLAFSGEVTRAGDTLTVRTDGQDRQVSPGQGLVVVRDGKDARLGDIQATDRVNVTLGPDGNATRIEATSTGGAPNPAGTTFSGEVTGAGQPLAVRTDGGERSVEPGAGLVVIRDGKDATLGDIQRSDRVNVTVGPDGRATRIEATSQGGGLGWLRWLLPLLLLLGLLALLPLLLRRRRDSFILERDSAVAARPVASDTPNTTQHTVVDAGDTADRASDERVGTRR